jgi:hypothetical protein
VSDETSRAKARKVTGEVYSASEMVVGGLRTKRRKPADEEPKKENACLPALRGECNNGAVKIK